MRSKIPNESSVLSVRLIEAHRPYIANHMLEAGAEWNKESLVDSCALLLTYAV